MDRLSHNSNIARKPINEQLRVPRIRVAHLLAWLGLAVVLNAGDLVISAMEMRALQHSPTAKSLDPSILYLLIPWWTRLLNIFVTAAFAACLVGFWALVRSRCFRSLGSLQPGQWLVLSFALDGIMVSMARPFELINVTLFQPHNWALNIAVTIMLLNITAVGTLRSFAAIRLQDAMRWRVLLALCAANVLQIGYFVIEMRYSWVMYWVRNCTWLLPWWWAFLVLATLVVVVLDRPRWAARDWVHWLGVSLWILQGATMLLLSIAFPQIVGVFTSPARTF